MDETIEHPGGLTSSLRGVALVLFKAVFTELVFEAEMKTNLDVEDAKQREGDDHDILPEPLLDNLDLSVSRV